MNISDAQQAERLLIVDDSPLNTKMLQFMLRQAGYETLVTDNGHSAIELVANQRPDLILLDVMMPEMDGFETCRRIKENPVNTHVPVIFITALSETENVVRGFKLGGVDYITKPFNKEVLLVRVKNHLALLHNRRKVEDQAKVLEASNRLKDRMFSIISHDLRSPVGSIKLTLDLISRGLIKPDSDEFDGIVRQLLQSSEDALNLLENLLGWAKAQSDKLAYNPETIDLKELAERSLRLHKLNFSQKGIKVTAEVPEGLAAHADLHMINSVLRNLLSNAIKFTPREGEIGIRAHANGGKQVVVEVSDSGVGIPEEHIEKIFSRRDSVTTPGTEKEGGSGLGLLLCQDFIEKNGGEISVQSKVGEGTTFSFTLPCAS